MNSHNPVTSKSSLFLWLYDWIAQYVMDRLLLESGKFVSEDWLILLFLFRKNTWGWVFEDFMIEDFVYVKEEIMHSNVTWFYILPVRKYFQYIWRLLCREWILQFYYLEVDHKAVNWLNEQQNLISGISSLFGRNHA